MDMTLEFAPSPNGAYLTSCLRHSAQIQPYGWTSDTLGTLSELLLIGKQGPKTTNSQDESCLKVAPKFTSSSPV